MRCNVIPMFNSRTIGRRVVDFYPDEDGVTLYIWTNEHRDAGHSVRCTDRLEVLNTLRGLESRA